MTLRVPPQRVPTLTEVIELDERPSAELLAPPVPAPPEAALAEPSLPAAAAVTVPPNEDELTARVLVDVQRQVELMLEHRLREALMPALLRATDTMILEVRTELASTLRELVSRAVAQELARHRHP